MNGVIEDMPLVRGIHISELAKYLNWHFFLFDIKKEQLRSMLSNGLYSAYLEYQSENNDLLECIATS